MQKSVGVRRSLDSTAGWHLFSTSKPFVLDRPSTGIISIIVAFVVWERPIAKRTCMQTLEYLPMYVYGILKR